MTVFGVPEQGGPVTKTMALSQEEFWKSLAVMAGPTGIKSRRLPASIACGSGHVEVNFHSLPPTRLGGLLELPRAEVTILFRGVEQSDQAVFLRRFDLAFQRGGG